MTPVETPAVRWRMIIRNQAKTGLKAPPHPPRVNKRPPISAIIIPSSNNTTRKIQSELPVEWIPIKHRQDRAQTISKQKKPKTRGLTDGQRAAWAHTHYIINHGSANDAARFLTFPKNVNHTPTEALHQVRVMARRRVPTWEQAKDTIFSSSESSIESLVAHTRLCTNIIPRHVDEPRTERHRQPQDQRRNK